VVAKCIRGTDFAFNQLRVNLPKAPLRGYTTAEFARRSAVAGDIIIEKSGGGENQPVGRAVLYDGPEPVMPTNFAGRLRPFSSADCRYVTYLLASLYSDGVTRSAIKQTTGIQNLDTEALLSTHVSVPLVEEQRAIADYLDTETARIDALITKKRRMIELLEERHSLAFEAAIGDRGLTFAGDLDHDRVRGTAKPAGWRIPKLSSVLRQLTNGYVGPTRDILRDKGIRYIQGMHLKAGGIDFDRRPFYVENAWHSARPRTTLSTGDVLIVQTGDIGQVAVVPPEFGDANCHALLIARTIPELMYGQFLAAYLQSRIGYFSLIRMATGALHPHLESSIRDVPVVLPPLSAQSAIVHEVADAQHLAAKAIECLDEQLDLLAERRQALITAAVTGELEIPGVAA